MPVIKESELRYCFRIYNGNSALETALNKAGISYDCIFDTVSTAYKKNEEYQVSYWRPFLENRQSPLFIPILPWVFSPRVLVLEKSLDNLFNPGDLISPFIFAPATRSIYDLIAVGKDGGRPVFSRINKALSRPGSKWQRRSIYLCRKSNPDEDWKQLWTRFLEKGFLLPPDPGESGDPFKRGRG